MNLFNTDDEVMKFLESRFGDCEGMCDYLECRLKKKGLGSIKKVIEAIPSVGTHDTPIFSGKFICTNGTAKVKCVRRAGIHKKHHWAVYIELA